MARYTNTERLGVNATESIFLNKINWIFREQPIVDMGIDAHVEKVENGNPTGELIALQIKTGNSHFVIKEKTLTYYGETTHLEYWLKHSLPVILIAHLPDSKETFWVHINSDNVVKTEKGWKVAISKTNVLDSNCKPILSEISSGPISIQKFNKLSLDEPLIRHIETGGHVAVELEDWVNKSLGRTPVKIFIDDEYGDEILNQEWFQIYTGYGIKELVETLFPWATVSIDSDFYDEHSEDESWEEGYTQIVYEDNSLFSTHNENEIYPYSESSGEVEYYRLKLKLNELGKAFFVISNHLNKK